MKIDKDALIGGVQVMVLRDFFREYRDYAWDAAFVRDALSLSHAAAAELLAALDADGLIEPYAGIPVSLTVLLGANGHCADDLRAAAWRTTTKGNSLANLSFGPRVLRKTAERALHDFMRRVEDVKRDDRWLLKVRRVIVFGSYLDTAVETLGDVDLALELEWKEPKVDRRRGQLQAYVRREADNGRAFHTYLEELIAPEEDVLRYLKGGSRTLKFYDARDAVLTGSVQEVIYTDSEARGSSEQT